jgi:hypothetical protein
MHQHGVVWYAAHEGEGGARATLEQAEELRRVLGEVGEQLR